MATCQMGWNRSQGKTDQNSVEITPTHEIATSHSNVVALDHLTTIVRARAASSSLLILIVRAQALALPYEEACPRLILVDRNTQNGRSIVPFR